MVSVGSDMVTRMAALEGVRVADLSGAIGADATKLLGDLGADVVTVEPPGGDRLRLTPPFVMGPALPIRRPRDRLPRAHRGRVATRH